MLTRTNERKGHNGSIYQLYPAPDGGCYSVAGDGWLVHWPPDRPELGQLVAKVEGGQLFSLLAVEEKGLLVAGGLDGGLHWLYPAEPANNQHRALHRKAIYALATVGTDRLFCAGGDGLLSCWSLTTGRVTESLPLSTMALRSLVYSHQLGLLFVGSSDHHIYAVEPQTMAVVGRWKAHASSVFSLALWQEGSVTVLFSGGRDALLKRWTLDASGAPVGAPVSIPAHNFTVNDIALSPDGRYLATASRDKTLKLWNPANLELKKVAEVIRDRGHVNSVNALLWLDDRRLLSASDDRRILEWKVG